MENKIIREIKIVPTLTDNPEFLNLKINNVSSLTVS